MAVTSIILGNGLSDFMGSNEDPNNPADPDLQTRYNHAAIQVGRGRIHWADSMPSLHVARHSSARLGRCSPPPSSPPSSPPPLPLPAPSRQVAFIAGCFYTAVGLFRMGWLTNFLSSAVISGFMTGASVIIAMSQVGQERH